MLTLKKGASRVFIYFLEIFVIVISVFPILWVIMSAFKTNGEILSDPLALPPLFHLTYLYICLKTIISRSIFLIHC